MKWALSQLFKYGSNPFEINVEYNFKSRIVDIDDILDISTIKVTGFGQHLHDDRYIFNLHIEGMMILECGKTLEPVDYPLSLDVSEIFDTIDDGEVNVIPLNTIDLEEVVWENVYLEKPIAVYKDSINK